MKNKVNSVLGFIVTSLALDWQLVVFSPLIFKESAEFLLKKYFLIIKHTFIPVQLGNSHVNLFGMPFYYVGRFGLAGFQRILVTHFSLIKNSGIDLNKPLSVIDIGANMGAFTKLITLISKKHKVWAVEPNKAAFACLQKNFFKNSRVKKFNLAVSNENGVLKMNLPEKTSWLSHISTEGELVEAKTLDSLAMENSIKKVDILKIDVEGFEDLVLKGALQILSKTSIILMEVNLQEGNYSFSELVGLLKSSDFDFELKDLYVHRDSKGVARALEALFVNLVLS